MGRRITGIAVVPRTSGAPGKRSSSSSSSGQVARLSHSTSLVSNLSSGARESGQQLLRLQNKRAGKSPRSLLLVRQRRPNWGGSRRFSAKRREM